MANTDDMSSVISIVPVDIDEFKPGLYPGHFKIPKCLDVNKPEILHVTGSVQMFQIAGQRNPLPVETISITIARAIVNDYCSSQLVQGNPGITFMFGRISVSEILSKHKKILDELISAQKEWFINLVKLADNDWQHYKHHRVISETSRFAARALGFLDREWLIDLYTTGSTTKCRWCEQVISKTQVICHHCRGVQDNEKAISMGLKIVAA